MIGSHQPRIHAQAAGLDAVVVVTANETPTTELADAQATPVTAVFGVRPRQADDAMHDRVDVQPVFGGATVVQQQRGATTPGEVLLERQHLTPVTQRRARQQAQLGQRVEHHSLRLQRIDLVEDAFGGVTQFHLSRVEHRVLRVGVEVVCPFQRLEHLDAVEGPAVRCRHFREFGHAFRQRHVQDAFSVANAFQQELHRQRGLAGARHAFHQIQPVGRVAAGQHVIQAG